MKTLRQVQDMIQQSKVDPRLAKQPKLEHVRKWLVTEAQIKMLTALGIQVTAFDRETMTAVRASKLIGATRNKLGYNKWKGVTR